MMVSRKIMFVLNPKAGRVGKGNIRRLIETDFPQPGFSICETTSVQDLESLKKKLLREQFTDVIACGGDGTANKVAAIASALNLTFGVLPLGSGNGLARSVGMEMDLKKALQQLAVGKWKKVDVGVLNGMPFFCAAGIGFDAHISRLFENARRRGVLGYILLMLREFFFYKSGTYIFQFNGISITRKSFLAGICNSSQYGNGFHIAPGASMEDGRLNLAILRPFPRLFAPYIIWKAFRAKINKTRWMEIHQVDCCTIHFKGKGWVHLDGEPVQSESTMQISIRPASLKIICG